MTCEHCIHYDLCKDDYGRTDYFNEDDIVCNPIQDKCYNFDDKDKYIKIKEIPNRKIYHLKITPKYFNDDSFNNKTFEIRKKDRNYKIGDILVLEEFENDEYTGRDIKFEISYILDDTDYVKDGYVILGIN